MSGLSTEAWIGVLGVAISGCYALFLFILSQIRDVRMEARGDNVAAHKNAHDLNFATNTNTNALVQAIKTELNHDISELRQMNNQAVENMRKDMNGIADRLMVAMRESRETIVGSFNAQFQSLVVLINHKDKENK